MEPFILKPTVGTPYFSLPHWESKFPHLIVGFSSRKVDDDWSSSNYALHVANQNDQYKVIENRKKLAEELRMQFSSWTSGEQVHGTHIAVVTHGDRGKGCKSQESALSNTDGLITNEQDILLATYYADCVPLYFYSSDTDMVGTVHAGWKGTVSNIVGKAVEAFIECGANVENIFAAIGPSICVGCFLVDEKVINLLRGILPEESTLLAVIQRQGSNHWNLNLKEVNKILMRRAGVLEGHISVSSWCTSCNPRYFHSHRRDKGNTGRMVAWIGKKERI